MGVQFKTGVEIGKDFTFAQLRENGFKAFFIAIGAHECKRLGIEGESLTGVYPGVEFLREVNLGNRMSTGQPGGGHRRRKRGHGFSANRPSHRLTKPFIIYRRSRDEMPASREEIAECEDEGIEIKTLTHPVRIIGDDAGNVKAIECIQMALGEPDASGRRKPVPVKGSEFVIEVDAVIPAIGQESDWACLTEECACTLTGWGTMVVDPVTLQSMDPDIFSGGDAVTGPKTVVEAIQAGKEAAISINRFIQGKDDIREGREIDWAAVVDVPVEGAPKAGRQPMTHLPSEIRVANFNEVQLGFEEETTRKEADRCLACGICSECYQCVDACLANAVDHKQETVVRNIPVGSVILCPGSQAFDPRPSGSSIITGKIPMW